MSAATPHMPETDPRQSTRSLSRQVMTRVLLFGTIIVTVATVFSYSLVFNRSKNTTLTYLTQYMEERRRQELQIFDDARQRLAFFEDEYMKMYLSDVEYDGEDFRRLYQTGPDGATRMKRDAFDEHFDPRLGRSWGVSSFIGNNQSVDDPDFQRRLIIAAILVNRYAPAWYPEGCLHVTYPENAVSIFYPDSPWGLDARPDLPMNELGTIKATLQSENPERRTVWTGLYYDETGKYWTITCEVPVDLEGRHLFNPSMDVRLESIMERLGTVHPEGAYNFLIARDGTLIAHPGDLKDEQKWQGQLSLEKIDNPDIVRMYRDITAGAEPDAEVTVIDDPDGGNSLLAAFLPGPDWWLVLVYPEELISREAHHAARIVLVLGFSLFVLYYIVVSYVIARQVRSPLGRLQEAIALVTDGRYNEVSQSPDKLPLDQKNEIGQLAAAFLNMARVVFSVNTNLQQIVENRTRELEDANAKLRALSLLDGLTGIHNRRSFDRDLAGVFEQAKQGVETFSLLLCDVDLFKAYNDLYGHTEGDEVLRRIAGVIDANIREGDRVYRYGGEELAVLFNHADGNVAAAIGERILDAVRALGIPHQDGGHGVVTISGGLVEFSPDFQNPTDMVKAADDGLYRAKSSGRNRLETAPGPEQEGTRG